MVQYSGWLIDPGMQVKNNNSNEAASQKAFYRISKKSASISSTISDISNRLFGDALIATYTRAIKYKTWMKLIKRAPTIGPRRFISRSTVRERSLTLPIDGCQGEVATHQAVQLVHRAVTSRTRLQPYAPNLLCTLLANCMVDDTRDGFPRRCRQYRVEFYEAIKTLPFRTFIHSLWKESRNSVCFLEFFSSTRHSDVTILYQNTPLLLRQHNSDLF